MNLDREFEEVFNKNAEHKYFAPGRVNLIGEHIDYNGGHVFPCAISQGTYAWVSPREDRIISCYSINFEEEGRIEWSLDNLSYDDKDGWTNYIKGMFRYLEDFIGEYPFGLDILIKGNIPNGAGLSSSASLEMLSGIMIMDIYNIDISKSELIKLGQRVENDFLGLQTGIMDQFAVVMGKKDYAMYLDVEKLEYEYVPANIGDYIILIMNTNKRRELKDSKYNQRRMECEMALQALKEHIDIKYLCDLSIEEFKENSEYLSDSLLLRRARHAVTENHRTMAANKALNAGDLKLFGHLMNESHISLRDDYDITGDELDTLVQSAWEFNEVIGARMTGAGMGGCAIALVLKDYAEEVSRKISEIYIERFGYSPSFYIAEVGDGAKKLG